MGAIKIYHYRDHHNGGKFDGNCAVDTLNPFGSSTSEVRCRLRINKFDSGLETIWGVGIDTGNNQYALKVVESSGKYYFRVRWLDVDYDFSAFLINDNMIYEVKVIRIASSRIDILISDEYANALYYLGITNTSDETTYSISTDNIYVGSTNNSKSIEEPFTGIVYNWKLYDPAIRYIFYKNYNSVTDSQVADLLNVYNGSIIGTQPSNFWSIRTDISGKIKDGDSAILKQKQDKFRTQIGTSANLTLFNYDEIKKGDTIEFQFGDDVGNDNASCILNVTSIKQKSYYQTDITCEDIFMGLKYLRVYALAYSTLSTTKENIYLWWSTYIYASHNDYYSGTNTTNRYISLNYILNLILCSLQYDNLVSLNITTLLSTDSGYKYLDTGVVYSINYSSLIWHIGMTQRIGASDFTEETTYKSYVFFRSILQALRITYYFSSGDIKFTVLSSPGTTLSPYILNDKEKIMNSKFYQIIAPVIEGTPGGSISPSRYYSAYSSSDFTDRIANNVDSAFLLDEKELIIDVKLIKGFWIYRKHSAGSYLMQIENNDYFIDQYVTMLDNELRGLKQFEEKTITLTNENSEYYRSKEDDLVKQRSKIKQEVTL